MKLLRSKLHFNHYSLITNQFSETPQKYFMANYILITNQVTETPEKYFKLHFNHRVVPWTSREILQSKLHFNHQVVQWNSRETLQSKLHFNHQPVQWNSRELSQEPNLFVQKNTFSCHLVPSWYFFTVNSALNMPWPISNPSHHPPRVCVYARWLQLPGGPQKHTNAGFVGCAKVCVYARWLQLPGNNNN